MSAASYSSVGEISLKEARIEARAKLGQIHRGIDPTAPTGPGLTLRVAWERYKKAMQANGRSERTIGDYEDIVHRLLKSWLERPLCSIGEDLAGVGDRHTKITKRHGPAMANYAMRCFRAIYRHAKRKIDRKLPEHPVEAVTFNKERRRNTALKPGQLAAWERQRQALPNPIRRELHLFMLLSGMRPGATIAAQWPHLNVKSRILHVPAPRGGEDRAFDLPLSRPMLRCLWRARKAGRVMHERQAATWIFPAESKSGHIAEWKENRDDLSHFGNDLRQTWRTLAQAAGVSQLDTKLIMNHAVSDDVNAGYITRSALLDHLVAQQERISRHIS